MPGNVGRREAAICLPGDVVYGCSSGVLFIPPHLVEEVVDGDLMCVDAILELRLAKKK